MIDFTVYERGLRINYIKGPGSLGFEREPGDEVHVLESEGLTYIHHQHEIGAEYGDTIFILDPGPDVLVETRVTGTTFRASFGVGAEVHEKVVAAAVASLEAWHERP